MSEKHLDIEEDLLATYEDYQEHQKTLLKN